MLDNLNTTQWSFTDAELERLNEVSQTPTPYPQWMATFQGRDREAKE